MTKAHAQFRILGPLELVVDGDPVELGSAKQRTLLAVLLLRAGEVVPVERLIDELWGDEPPPSATHSLEAYVSRVRRLVPAQGANLTRRGSGYCLDVGEGTLDADRFTELADEASEAARSGELEHAAELNRKALALWRGPALAGVHLGATGRTDRDRLEERRLAVAELYHDAQLRHGDYKEAVAPLQALVAEHPFREGLVARLMVALYASGRQAEALDVYERTRRGLRDELGLQPSAELQQLSGEIVRHELELPSARRPPAVEDAPAAPPRKRRLGRLLVVAAGALALAFVAGGSVPKTAPGLADAAQRVEPEPVSIALVLPRSNADAQDNRLLSWSFSHSARNWGFSSRTLTVEPGEPAAVERLVQRIGADGPDYVVAVGEEVSHALAPAARRYPSIRFAFVDASLADLSLPGARNAVGLRFAEEHTAELMGYLGALVPTHRVGQNRVDAISLVVGPDSPENRRVVRGVERGVRGAGRSVSVSVDHIGSVDDPTACEQVANERIDAGADVVYVDAGPCGLGAVAVARTRGVWAVGGRDDGVLGGSHVLAITYKDWERALGLILDEVGEGTFTPGSDRRFGLEDDYAVGVDTPDVTPGVTEALWSRVVERCSKIRQRAAVDEA